ncbi:UDP-glucose/GDP-mannose dehydrogenase family protein [Nocardia gipuzkoensis]|uniref:UDP-glucose dehydrogenase family protein n=1 Tax=Nocardia gipuzkoensis TaxID=2749991 RepID=UPI001E5D018E|nr:UDP-glucose/GDP-mannose dehydrogenase family protein [Nocardia gipuzkoensis]UGT70847.1 UDP-glucose/GDP-mannose dehydrogenase family protein [Nocardia gipuzkoensis]
MTSQHRITVLGAGYVGLTTGACLASLGHNVVCVDSDPSVVAALRSGHTHLAEPDLNALVRAGLAAGTLGFDTEPIPAISHAQIVILCLPTPDRPDGSADLTAIDTTIAYLRHELRPSTVIVIKSTVPVGTHHRITAALDRDDVAVVSNPEFLREGHAVYDFLHPTRIVLGNNDPAACKRVASLYDAIRTEIITTDPASAELAKYAANAFLATKLSFINSIAALCDRLGADITDITHILGADPRIGTDYLKPGPGWGGPCLPKDTTALLHQTHAAGQRFDVLDAAIRANRTHQQHIVDRLRNELGGLHDARIGTLGTSFKAGTNDHRRSPALRIIHALLADGATIAAHDPTAQPRDTDGIQLCRDPHDVAHSADAILLLTDWIDYHTLDWRQIASSMAGDLVFDTRNTLNVAGPLEAGLRCLVLGRPNTGKNTG